MREIISFLKKSVDRTNNGCYEFKDGTVYAQSTAFQAGADLQVQDNMSVQAEEIEKFLDRTKGEPKITIKDGVVTMVQGRLRSTMRSYLGVETEPVNLSGGEWQAIPPTFSAGLAQASLFTGDRIYTQGVRLTGNRLTAINSRCGIDIFVDGMDIEGELLLHTDAAKYIAEFVPDEMQQRGDNSLVFRWEDGRWLRTQVMTEKFPVAVDNLFLKLGGDAPCPIDDEWKAAYADAASFTDKTITILPDRFIVERNASMVEVAAATAVPKDHSSKWSKEVLDLVVQVADAWNPAGHPEPCLFRGPKLRGLCMGVK